LTILLSFAAVSFLASVIPGPDTAVVTKNAITRGRRAAIRYGGRLQLWSARLGAASIVGIGTLLATSVIAFTIDKLIGASYLIALGVPAIIASRRHCTRPVAEIAGAPMRNGRLGSYHEGCSRTRSAEDGAVRVSVALRITGWILVGLGIRVALEHR